MMISVHSKSTQVRLTVEKGPLGRRPIPGQITEPELWWKIDQLSITLTRKGGLAPGYGSYSENSLTIILKLNVEKAKTTPTTI